MVHCAVYTKLYIVCLVNWSECIVQCAFSGMMGMGQDFSTGQHLEDQEWVVESSRCRIRTRTRTSIRRRRWRRRRN